MRCNCLETSTQLQKGALLVIFTSSDKASMPLLIMTSGHCAGCISFSPPVGPLRGTRGFLRNLGPYGFPKPWEAPRSKSSSGFLHLPGTDAPLSSCRRCIGRKHERWTGLAPWVYWNTAGKPSTQWVLGTPGPLQTFRENVMFLLTHRKSACFWPAFLMS